MDFTEREMELIVQGLKCAAAISWDNGHSGQAKMFGDLWQKIERDNDENRQQADKG